jgi:hypothetical protein
MSYTTWTDGEVLYAGSLNNNFNLVYPKLIGFKEQRFEITSGTAVKDCGSIYYSGIFPSIFYDYLNVSTYGMSSQGTNMALSLWFEFSGTTANFSTGSLYTRETGADTDYFLDYVLTSGTATASGLNMGSPFWISVKARTTDNAMIGNIKAIGV